jgi:hypothetical protein
VLAQQQKPQPSEEPKLTKTTVADDRYGKGGTQETFSDEKLRVDHELWKDKDIPTLFAVR